ncbi:MAG: MG2 domain-containing protein, partial [Bacteroidota bacterium]
MKHQSIPSLFFVTILLLFGFSSCDQSTDAKEITESIANYVYSYTSGSISKATPIRVQLTMSVDNDLVGSEVEKDVISFKPSIEGTATWVNTQTILFQPNEYLPSNKKYLGKVALSKIFEKLPADAKTFEFNFYTQEQHYYVSVEGLKNDPSGNEKKKQLKGWLKTADVADNVEVEKIVTAKQNGKELPISWQHLEGNIKHNFTVENIQRGQEVGEVEVFWDGKPLDVDKRSSQKVEIPPLGEFKIMDAKVVKGDKPHIILYFSDPIKKSQDLKGLISIKDFNGKLNYLIDGSEVKIYPQSKGAGTMTVKATAGIQSAAGYKMAKSSEWDLVFEQMKPRVRLVGNGVIMPNSNGLMFPFDAVNLNYVDVEVLKVFNNNILQFLQNNEVDGQYSLNQVGRIIMQKQVRLAEINADAQSASWSRYALDLSELINDDPHAIYQVSLGFRPEYASYGCSPKDQNASGNNTIPENPFAENDGKKFNSIWNIYRYNYEGYRYDHRNDPCYPAYYNSDRFRRRNVLASDMGILAKKGADGKYMLAVTDLRTTMPMDHVDLEFYDYQQQIITKTMTDNNGMAATEFDEAPFVVVAKKDNQRGYLKLFDQNSLPLSRFDVGGAYAQKGLKGFLYGERGVWRPGDSIYLNFVLEDKAGNLPPNHPVTFELYDARGQLKEKRTVLDNVNKVYALHTATNSEDATGNWRAVVKVGGADFSKTLKVETVKPNRLKIKMDFGKEKLVATDEKLNGDLQVNWLH